MAGKGAEPMIDVASKAGVWTLTLNRPDKANALTAEMLVALDTAVDQVQTSAARVLVLTGRGKVFSAGADLAGMQAGLGSNPVWERLSGRIAALPCLTIAALNGTVAGGALGMVLACDLRLAVPQTTVFYPVMRLGFLPQPSDPARLVALVGPSRARLILMAGERIGAEQALDWGLFDRLVPAEDLQAAALSLGEAALAAKPGHAAAIKALLR
jgi:enoyl-CoA hydratase/carnithine racemase